MSRGPRRASRSLDDASTTDRRGSPHARSVDPPVSPPLWWSILPAAACLVLYLLQAPRVSGDKDASEFTVILGLGGVAHPTGYTFYVLAGHFFVLALHRLGATFAYAANAWSAVGGAVAIFFLHRLMVRLVPAEARLGARARAGIALVPLAFFALNPMWSMETELAEVMSWHVAWVAGVSLLFLRLLRAEPGSARTSASRRDTGALAWGFLCGLGLAHHLTSVFASFPMTCVLIGQRARRREPLLGWLVQGLVAGAIAPAIAYGIIAYRAFHPTLAQWPMLGASWGDAWRHCTGAQYRWYLGHFSPSPEQRHYLARYVYPVLVPALAALVGAALVRLRPATRLALRTIAVVSLLGTGYAFGYGVPDPSSYFLAPLALALAAVPALFAACVSSAGLPRHAARVGLVAAIAGAALLAGPWLRVASDRKQTYVNFEALVHGMWASIPYERGFVLWADDMYARLHEYQWLRHEKPGLEVQDPWVLTHPVARARFAARFGFDPLAGLSFSRRADGTFGVEGRDALSSVHDLISNINLHTNLPVIHFAPEAQSVRLLEKPAGADTSRSPAAEPRAIRP